MNDVESPDAMTLRLPRRPVVDSAQFRTAMSAIGASVHVVTARQGDEQIGRTVTSLMSLTADPPAILVSIDSTSRLAALISATGGFSVAVLADDQSNIADAFAGRLAAAERFGLGAWSHWPSGHPRLAGSAASLDCEVIGAIDTGSHVLFAGAIVAAVVDDGRRPLIWQQHHYHHLAAAD